MTLQRTVSGGGSSNTTCSDGTLVGGSSTSTDRVEADTDSSSRRRETPVMPEPTEAAAYETASADVERTKWLSEPGANAVERVDDGGGGAGAAAATAAGAGTSPFKAGELIGATILRIPVMTLGMCTLSLCTLHELKRPSTLNTNRMPSKSTDEGARYNRCGTGA